MLYQPTNLAPSTLGELGSGVFDVTQPLEVSWQVNGNSALTDYQIDFYTNDGSELLFYSTGKQTPVSPFYGVDANGNAQRFVAAAIDFSAIEAYNVVASSILAVTNINYGTFGTAVGGVGGVYWFKRASATWQLYGKTAVSGFPSNYGITLNSQGVTGDIVVVAYHPGNGASYQYKVTQWWSATDSIEQMSASVFLTRAVPTLTMTMPTLPLTTKDATFSASYSQSDGDAVLWARWRIAAGSDLSQILYDSGIVYTQTLSMTYDGFLQGVSYAVRCDAESVNGVACTTGWRGVTVDYLNIHATTDNASCDRANNNITLDATGLKPLYGMPRSGATISYGNDGATISGIYQWGDVNNNNLSVAFPFYALLQFRIDSGTSGVIMQFSPGMRITRSGSSLYFVSQINEALPVSVQNGDYVTLFITPTSVFQRVESVSGGLQPSTTLTPSITLVPDGGTNTVTVGTLTLIPTDWSANIVQTRQIILRNVTVSCLQIWSAAPDYTTTQEIKSGTYDSAWDSDTVFLAQFNGDTNASVFAYLPEALASIGVYRSDGETLTLVENIGNDGAIVKDYGAPQNQQGWYTYYYFPVGESGNVYEPIVSNAVRLCSWNWSLLVCSEQNDGTYQVLQAFQFANNVTTAEISNNNTPGVFGNLSRYPTVQRSVRNYKSGVLNALIGTVTNATYADTAAQRDAIFALATSNYPLFLKSRKGDVWRVAISGEITMETADTTKEQTQSVSLPWVEIGSANGVSIHG